MRSAPRGHLRAADGESGLASRRRSGAGTSASRSRAGQPLVAVDAATPAALLAPAAVAVALALGHFAGSVAALFARVAVAVALALGAPPLLVDAAVVAVADFPVAWALDVGAAAEPAVWPGEAATTGPAASQPGVALVIAVAAVLAGRELGAGLGAGLPGDAEPKGRGGKTLEGLPPRFARGKSAHDGVKCVPVHPGNSSLVGWRARGGRGGGSARVVSHRRTLPVRHKRCTTWGMEIAPLNFHTHGARHRFLRGNGVAATIRPPAPRVGLRGSAGAGRWRAFLRFNWPGGGRMIRPLRRSRPPRCWFVHCEGDWPCASPSRARRRTPVAPGSTGRAVPRRIRSDADRAGPVCGPRPVSNLATGRFRVWPCGTGGADTLPAVARKRRG